MVSVFLLFSWAGEIQAQAVTNKGQTRSLPLTSYFTQEAYTRGYTSLALNYPFVRNQMISDIRQGRGQTWWTWIGAGVHRQESLSWWLMAEWYAQHKKPQQAYDAAIQALVLSKTELNMCDIGNKDDVQVERRLLQLHQNIVEYKPSQQNIKRAVLNAFTRTEQHLKTKHTLSGQTCHFAKVYLGYNVPDDLKIWERDYDQSRNMRAFADVKQKMGYDRFFEVTDINDVWNSERIGAGQK